MMRMVFLLIALGVLAAIAFRGPDQSPMDAVAEAGSKAKDAIVGAVEQPEFRVFTEEAKKAIERSRQMRDRMAKSMPQREDVPPREDDATNRAPEKGEGSSSRAPSPKPKPSSPEMPDRNRNAWVIEGTDGPPMPALPKTPVRQVELPEIAGTPGGDPSQGKSEGDAIQGIGALYRDADRLLEEIR